MTDNDFDVAIIGGGPAGAISAALLARAGFKVLLAEKNARPEKKICGEFICPQAFEILERVGVREMIEAAPHGEVRGMVLAGPNGARLETQFPDYEGRRGFRENGISISRPQFDGILVENSKKLGAEIWWGARLVALHMEAGSARLSFRLQGNDEPVSVRAAIVIGADGRASSVARFLGMSAPTPGRPRGVIHGFFSGVAGMQERGEMHILSNGAYCALNLLPNGVCNLALVDDVDVIRRWHGREKDRAEEVIASAPHLGKRFDGAQLCGELKVLMPLRVAVHRSWAERVMLVGDAGGFFDPFTGEGIYAAMRSGELAADVALEALAMGDFSASALERYGLERAGWERGKRVVWQAFQALIRRERLVNRFGAFLKRSPEVADLLVGLSGNYIPPRALLRPSVFSKLAAGLIFWF
ncbi:MAG: NAD(P)/FAD-dependent oxidoreductase [Nitrospinaceae bacterium]|jgi:menaquinone-9 beta-reductase|nr:NAD(P)/FAD-dependent oxidoreductase [Nitrospinaceae bacterium]MBT3435741.1 NAD(P)/FAD-dependent oxidoreductase [Nitrospinaceae bacterium]MBT3822623.1 NAD(P)/FAD-dependent oxidoreductase [Nitrospinaceae bacterium]MBT4429199.1 NAD(P)/FAD-dependent oxidoreductase [Nitrospinaceae bacterium]MBT5368072.1 NAD(P)/FAD-dependent oxidoreductase [Nitrospinaceae bacterium]